MDRTTALLLIAVGLAGYGVYTAAYVPAMLVGPPMPFLLIGFVLQVVCALAAAIGVWRGRRWAASAVLLLGASIAATALIEGFLGVVAYLRALLVAVLAIVTAMIIAAYVNQRRGPVSRIDS